MDKLSYSPLFCLFNNDRTDNWYYSWIVALLVFHRPMRSVLIYFGDMIHVGLGRYLSVSSVLITIVVLQFPRIIATIRVTSDIIFLFVFVALSFVVSFISIGNISFISDYAHEGINTFIKAFPFYIFAKQIYDYTELKVVLRKAALITVVLMSIMTIVGYFRKDLFESGLTYNQFYGMILAPSCVVLLMDLIENHSVLNFIMFVASVSMIAYYGSRMPFAVLVVALILLLFSFCIFGRFFKIKRSSIPKYSIIRAVIFIGSLISGVIALSSLLVKAKGQDSIGEGARMLYFVSSGNFVKSTSRLVIWKEAFRYAIDHPFCGCGIIADRIILAHSPEILNHYGVDGFENWIGFYAHNIFLEFMMQYGLILGSVFGMVIIMIACIMLLENDRDKRIIAICVISLTFGVLLFSGPVFSSSWFWVMLGMGSGYLFRQRWKPEK